MSYRNKPNAASTSHHHHKGYNKNFGNKNYGVNRMIHHTRPKKPPRYNLSSIRSHIINEANDVDLERNTAATSSNRTITITTNRDNVDARAQRRPPRRVRIVDSVRDMVTDTKPRLAIGETQAIKPLPTVNKMCQLSTLDPNVFPNIISFVENYFQCYDNNRDDLLNVYHPKAIFSMSINMNNHASHQYRFGELIKDSRNLKHVPAIDAEKRFKMMHIGHIDTVNFLRNLQPSEHLKDSLKLDVSFYQPHMLTFSVDGVFKEGSKDAKLHAYRAFHRVFVCVPVSGRIGIINEQYSIANISIDQYKNYLKEEKPSLQPEIVQKPNPEDEKKAKIEKFSQETKLTFEWARDCLEHLNWDYAKALEKFNEVKGSIPADAFLL